MAPFLEVQEVDKRFGDLRVLERISLAVGEGEILALLGPSGSGKTTLLRVLAGFERPAAGKVVVGGRDVTGLSPAARGFGMVFQHYALFPHLTVGANVAFGLEARPSSAERHPAEISRRVAEMLHLVDLEGFAERKVGEISGGQQQRVALARALAPSPRLLLLDEPLSNLDPSLRERTRRELKRTIQAVGITTVLVTHEQDEAFDLGNRVAVLWRGALQQVGSPEELYMEPANSFVGTFIGRSTPLAATVEIAAVGGAKRCKVRLDANGAVWPALDVDGLAAGEPCELLPRPEGLVFSPPDAARSVPGRVLERRYAGASTFYLVAIDLPAGSASAEQAVEVEVMAAADAAQPGDRVALLPTVAAPPPRAYRRSSSAKEAGA